jgi:Clp amino terminal domain, pathogenicity island component
MLLAIMSEWEGAYTGRFIRVDAESRRRGRGRRCLDHPPEGDASVPTLPFIRPRPYGYELPCPVQEKPTCERWEGIGARVLNRLQVQPSDVREQIETLHPVGKQPVGDGQIGITQQGKASIELAVQEARSLGHHYLGTEHLLLGLPREEAGLVSQVLLRSGVTLEKAREVVKHCLKRNKQQVRLSRISAGSHRGVQHHLAGFDAIVQRDGDQSKALGLGYWRVE